MIKRVYNYEIPQVLKEGSEDEVQALPPHDLYGWSEINEETGEILKTSRNWFQALPQIGVPQVEEEVGEPLITDFTKARDLKQRALALIDSDKITDLYGGDVGSDDEAFDALFDDEDDEVTNFNGAMSRTPYACDDKGLAAYESALAKSNQELEELRTFMAQKDMPLFQQFMALSDEEKAALLKPLDGNPPSNIDGNPIEE